MADILYAIWTVLSFLLGIVWSVVWFVLSDLLSTVLWLLILVWMAFAVRYRSFTVGSMALLRYGRWGVAMLWRWLRGLPAGAAPAEVREKLVIERRNRIPIGYVSLSAQMNMIVVMFFVLVLALS